MEDNFIEFISNIQVDNMNEICITLNEIAKKLNKNYYDINTSGNYILVGSMGRKTSIKGESDIDIIYELPNDIYKRFDEHEGNGQSHLLQEIKNLLKERYPLTDIKGDGQVVVISFDKYKVELVPGFKQENNSYKYPNTHDGGSWKNTNPLPEIEEATLLMKKTTTYKDLCQIVRQWKANNGVTIGGLLIDTIAKKFLDDTPECKQLGREKYVELLIKFFGYISEIDEDVKQWNALGSNQIIKNNNFNFIKKSTKTLKKLEETENSCLTLSELFGSKFPVGDNDLRSNGISSREEFIETLFPVYINENLKIDCRMSQNGYRINLLSEFIKKRYKVKQNRNLEFFIKICNVSKPYEIYWKVRNVGQEAIKRDCIRGQIAKGNEKLKEKTDFNGPHYVECYIVKDGVCIARDKQEVNIDGSE